MNDPPDDGGGGPERPRISELPADERPRERLVRSGPRALSDTELLALLIRSGTRSHSALDLARSLLSDHNGVRGVAQRTAAELMRVHGIGPAKAVGLVAAFELGRRAEAFDAGSRVILRSPEDVARRVVPMMRDRRTESFVVLILQADNSLKAEIELTTGTLNASLVHPREVYKAAIDHGAASIIVVHNHPSGNPEPSREDVEITRQLAEAGKIVGIPLHDHVIVAGSGFTSLAGRGLL